MLFQNPEIDLATLPQVETLELEQLSRKYLTVQYLGSLIFFGFLGVLLVILYFIPTLDIPDWGFGIGGSVWLFWILFSCWLTWKNFHYQGYAVRAHDIIYRRGVFWRQTIVIPFNRVQHAEVQQGPIERLFGLQTLEVYTAGGQSSDLTIPGLPGERAPQLKSFIMQKVGGHESGD